MGGRPAAAQFASLLKRFPFEPSRYATYPTAARFSERFGGAAAAGALREAVGARAPAALAVCLDGARDAQALACVEREAALVLRLGGPLAAQALGIHGVDAACLSRPAFARLLQALAEGFALRAAERLVELDAACATPAALAHLGALGLARVRLRARSEADEEALGAALERARGELGLPVDAALEHGRAGQRGPALARAVDAAVGAGAGCIVLNTPRARAPGKPRAGAEALAAALAAALERLCGAGYEYAGFDVFARPGGQGGVPFHARCEIVGLGPGAVSARSRWSVLNEPDPARYAAALGRGELPVAVGHRLSDDDRLRREVIHQIECLGSVSFSALEYKYGIGFAEYFAPELERLEALQDAGLAELFQDAVEVPRAARALSRLVSAAFDRYLEEERRNARST